jgi:hypothetical protein
MNQAENAVTVAAERGNDLKSGGCALAERATGKAREGFQLLAKQTREGIDRVGDLVRTNPASFLTVVFALGIGVGLLLAGTSPRRKGWW